LEKEDGKTKIKQGDLIKFHCGQRKTWGLIETPGEVMQLNYSKPSKRNKTNTGGKRWWYSQRK